MTRRDRWQAAISKFSSRAAAYAQAGVAPSLSLAHYESHILPTLSYIAQLVETDASVQHAFIVAVERMFHVPHRAVPEAVLLQLRTLGLPGAMDPMVYSAAALGRAAMVMNTEVLDEMASLTRARAQHAPLASLAQPKPGLNAEGSEDVAMVDMLKEALLATEGAMRGQAQGDQDRRAAPPPRRLQAHLRAVFSQRRIVISPGAALVRRVRRWVGVDGGPDAVLEQKITCAIGALQGTSPVFMLAELRTWTWSWVTHHRRGRGLRRCPLCFRANADMLPHVSTCRALWCQISRVLDVRRPSNAAEAIGLTESAAAPGRSRPRKARPQIGHLALAVACEAYHKVSAAESSQPARGDKSRRHTEAAVRNAARRLSDLEGPEMGGNDSPKGTPNHGSCR